MISNDLVQAALISKLKADAALDAAVDSEIREAQWQGAEFDYPAVRVELGTQTPVGDGNCYETNSEIALTIFSFSESDSSLQADQVAGLVNDAIFGKTLSGTGFVTGMVKSDGLVGAVRTGERVWRSVGLYRVNLFET